MTNAVATIRLMAPIVTIAGQDIVRIPKDLSKEVLPSRGQIFVKGTINGHPFTKVLEPDGYWSHWFRVDEDTKRSLNVREGDEVTIEVSPSKDWPEPTVPDDVAKALAAAPQKVKEKWSDITAMARWEWVRWVNATANPSTRAIRIEKTVSKLNGSHRRPCCFNLAACTDPELSKSGRLREV